MNTYDREYFVSRLRSGVYLISLNGVKIRVLSPSIEDEYYSNEVFKDAYDAAFAENIFTEDEMWEWMRSRDLWSDEKDDKIEGIQKDIDKLKVGMFEQRMNTAMVDQARRYIRTGEKSKEALVIEKHDLFSKTCEGLASQEKSAALFEKCCYVGKEPLDCESVDMSSLYYEFSRMLLNEKQLRELARNDPWRLSWLMKDHKPLFSNPDDRELSPDQKGILIWSNMYDNIQESTECPSEDVINDNDMLDGWFIIQRQNQEAEKNKTEMEKRTNSKIANSDEILVMANTDKEASTIHGMNSIHSDTIRKQRLATARAKGVAVDLDFRDKQIEVSNQHHENIKEQRGRK